MTEKYSAVERVPKEVLSKFDEEELDRFIKFYVKRELASHLADGIMSDAVKGEIIVSLTDMSQEEDERHNMVKYRQSARVDELVRCKDCKYWHREISNGIEYFNFSSCDLNRGGDGHNFYCADAERRTNE